MYIFAEPDINNGLLLSLVIERSFLKQVSFL